MTPPAGSTVAAHRNGAPARTRTRPSGGGSRHARSAAAMPRGARRASGPSAGLGGLRIGGAPALAGAGGAIASTPLGVRLARRCAGVQDARLLDRLIRGRLWIGLIAVMLIGLVFLQLSLLSLNAGIGAALQQSSVLERENAALRTDVSRMDAGQRVQDLAAADGMVMPAVGSIHFLTAGAVPAGVAARGISTPSPAAKAQTTPSVANSPSAGSVPPTTTTSPPTATATTATTTTATAATAAAPQG